MKMNLIEKILAKHSKYQSVKANDIIDISLDVRAARDFGGANVIKHLKENNLEIADNSKTFFTFDTNPTGSDQKYAVNQQICRKFAREKGFKVFDIDRGIGTHTFIEEGIAYPYTTSVTTDSHANILGAIGAFGQGMGDKDIASAFNKGKIWFKVPESVKIILNGKRPKNVSSKDIILNLLNIFGANELLGYSIEVVGEEVEKLTLDERITISSMATEMGAIIILFTPNEEIIDFCETRSKRKIELIKSDEDAVYKKIYNIDISSFVPMISLPGKPHDTIDILELKRTKIDSAFIGSCTNGRMEDMREISKVLKNKKVAPGVVLKIVPATDEVWIKALNEGLIKIFKDAGALVSNAGCAGCAAGQVGQNGEGEITISTGNRNFPGKQGKGKVFLASPINVVSSAVSGYITNFENIPEKPEVFMQKNSFENPESYKKKNENYEEKITKIEGKVWVIDEDNIDTDMIFHNRYLAITKISEMGQYTFDNLKNYEDFSKKAKKGDIIITKKNFGSGSSRQQAVDCFKALGIQAILAESFGAIYERNAINAAFPILTYKNISKLSIENGEKISLDFENGHLKNLNKNLSIFIEKFSEVQMDIYKNGGLF